MKLTVNRKRNELKILLLTAFFIITNCLIVNAIPLPNGADAMVKNVEKYESGEIKSVSLIEPTSITTPLGKFLFFEEKNDSYGSERNSKVEFYENGNFKSGYLKEKTVIKTPVGKYAVQFISFYEDGKLEKFSCPVEYDTKIQGSNFTRTAKDKTQIKTSIGLLPIAGIVELYPSNKIKKVSFGKDIFPTISAGNFKGIEITEFVEFFENGNVSTILLSKPQTIKTNLGKVKAANTLTLWDNGNIKDIELPEAQTFDTSIGYLSLVGISTYKSGKIEKCFLDDGRPNAVLRNNVNNKSQEVSTKWGKLNISGVSPITFYENGILKNCNLGAEYNLKTAPALETSVGSIKTWKDIKFYQNGSVKILNAYELADVNVATSQGTIKFDELFFYETGEFMGGLSGQIKKIGNDKIYQKYILFSKEGNYLGIAKYDEEQAILKISE